MPTMFTPLERGECIDYSSKINLNEKFFKSFGLLLPLYKYHMQSSPARATADTHDIQSGH
jgi:hypothetical protein